MYILLSSLCLCHSRCLRMTVCLHFELLNGFTAALNVEPKQVLFIAKSTKLKGNGCLNDLGNN